MEDPKIESVLLLDCREVNLGESMMSLSIVRVN